MNLGLYICSFYFMQSANKKKNAYCWDLNNPVSFDENYYNDAEAFFNSFFQAYARDQEDDPNRVFYIERESTWRGETDTFVYLMARIRSGIFGVEADIYDRKERQTVGKRNINQADVMPFLLFIAIPKPSTTDEDHPVNKGIMLFQSNGVYGVKSKTTAQIRAFAQTHLNSSFITRNVAPGPFLEQLFENGKLKKIHLIRNKITSDDADRLNKVYYGREERIISQLLTSKMEEIIYKLKRFGMNPEAVYEWDDGNEYQNVKVYMEIDKGIYRTIDLHHFENRSILEYIPDRYRKENGHANEDEILSYFIERSKFYLARMAVSLKP